MGQGVQVPIVADVAQAVTGVRRLGDEFDKVSDALDDVDRSSGTAERNVRADLGKIEDKAEDAAKGTRRAFSEAFDDVRRDSRRATDDVAADTRRSMDRAGSATGEFKQEAIQNVAETASSFNGSMDDIASMVQGTLGGLATLPGVGLGVAAVGALGGVVYSMWKSNAEAVEQRVQEMFDSMVESGANYLTQAQVQEAVKALYDDEGKMASVRQAAEDLGLSVESVATAYVTAGGARDAVQAKAVARIAEEQAGIDALRESVIHGSRAEQESAGHAIQDREATIAGYQAILDKIDGQADATDNAAARADEYRRTVALAQANVRGEYQATADTQARTTQAAIDKMNELKGLVGGLAQRVPITIDTTAAEKQLREWHPDVTVRARVGSAQVV